MISNRKENTDVEKFTFFCDLYNEKHLYVPDSHVGCRIRIECITNF